MNLIRYNSNVQRPQTSQYLPFQTSVSPAIVISPGTYSLIPGKLSMLKALLELLSGDFLQSQAPSHASHPACYFAITDLFSPRAIPASFISYLVHQTGFHLTLGSIQKASPLSKSKDLPVSEETSGQTAEVPKTSQQPDPEILCQGCCVRAAWLARGRASQGPPLKEHVYFAMYVLVCRLQKFTFNFTALSGTN